MKKFNMRSKTRETCAGLLFTSPWIIGFLIFTIYPICMSLYYSFCSWHVVRGARFTGFTNFNTLFNDANFYTALYNTMYTVVIGVTITTLVALSASILMNNKKIKGLSFFRVIFFIPTLMPLVINCILWLWILQSDIGLINTLLGYLGIQGPKWLASPVWSKPALILMMIWGCGNAIIIYLAGLQDVPESLYESAELDGANFWQRTIYITIPMISPVLLYNVVNNIIGVLQWFAEPQVMTSGGPNNSTLFYSLYLYQNAFQFNKMGYASAMAWILLLIAMAIILGLFKGLGKLSDQ
ncbi:MAG: sugar ABC transporter permease [Clostridiales bacterium]|jgi:multiple sugar transport system permease protein|nr:sugar ABC transporter permease [Clostridiales bacterium]